MSTKSINGKHLYGWVQECKACGHIGKYDQYSPHCKECESTEHDIYFICPVCGAKSLFGETKCSGCHKELSFLNREQCIRKDREEAKRARQRRVIAAVVVGLVFFGLTLLAGLCWPIASFIAVGALVFTLYI